MKRKHARAEKSAPARPEGIPEDASYDARHATWCSGQVAAGKRTGAWVFHYSDGTLAGRASYENDIVLAAATLLWFRKLSSDNLNDQSNIMSEEQVAKLARQLNDIVQKFHLGITEPNEMLGDLVIRLQEAGVRF